MTAPLDPVFEALLANPRAELRPPAPGMSINQIRAAANAFMALAPRPPVHEITDVEAQVEGGELRLRVYRPSSERELPLVLFMHGGGFVLGDLESHDAMARTIANDAASVVAAVQYRLAPEHPFPAAIVDCAGALHWLVRSASTLRIDPNRIALVGDSAGGQLAAVVALLSRDEGLELRHLGLLYPLLDPGRSSGTAQALASGFMLSGSFIDWAWDCYTSGGNRDDPLIDVSRSSLHGLPPTTIITAGYDPLRDEGEMFAEQLRRAGIPVELKRYDGMIHGFAGMPHVTPVAAEALALLASRLAASFSR